MLPGGTYIPNGFSVTVTTVRKLVPTVTWELWGDGLCPNGPHYVSGILHIPTLPSSTDPATWGRIKTMFK
jgi:hypothetical protein